MSPKFGLCRVEDQNYIQICDLQNSVSPCSCLARQATQPEFWWPCIWPRGNWQWAAFLGTRHRVCVSTIPSSKVEKGHCSTCRHSRRPYHINRGDWIRCSCSQKGKKKESAVLEIWKEIRQVYHCVVALVLRFSSCIKKAQFCRCLPLRGCWIMSVNMVPRWQILYRV